MTNAIDSHAFTVRQSDCDFYGHMNIARYIDGCSDGGFMIQDAWGLTRDDVLTGRRLAFAVVGANSSYYRELRVGDHVQVRSTLDKIGGKSAQVTHRFYKGEDMVFESVFSLVLMNLDTRKAMAVPDDLRADMLAAHAD
ncbi:MAG: thioesterase family protein [Pseudomonadota bacterium]